MGDFNRCIDLVLAEEGSYINHPDDPGGETKFGISKRAYPQLDTPALTLARAVDLYPTDYWQPINGDPFPDGLALLLLDTAVNIGPNPARSRKCWTRAYSVPPNRDARRRGAINSNSC